MEWQRGGVHLAALAHLFSDANHGFRHPDNEGFQPHYADLTWPLVTDFLQRRV
jgi:dienelactone hydrolase